MAGEWDASAKEAVTGVFDSLAPDWHTRSSPESKRVVTDALERGLDVAGGTRVLAIEAGAGVGTYTNLLGSRFGSVLSLDLSFEMIVRSMAESPHRLVADANRLPVADHAADGVVLINAFVFPEEVRRVLKIGGHIVWINSSGDQTPIHLSTDDLVRALPFSVSGVESKAGAGTWSVLVRED
jgi:ubiquinone/menaquinone biosynthesis C-methylase UbiE